MKVKIEYTTEVNDFFRGAINSYYGQEGLATREEVKRWFRAHGDSMNDDICFEYSQKLKSLELAEECDQ